MKHCLGPVARAPLIASCGAGAFRIGDAGALRRWLWRGHLAREPTPQQGAIPASTPECFRRAPACSRMDTSIPNVFIPQIRMNGNEVVHQRYALAIVEHAEDHTGSAE